MLYTGAFCDKASFLLPVPAFEQWGGFLFWVTSSGKNPKAHLPPCHPPLTSRLPRVSTRSQAREGGCSSQELEDAGRSLDVSCWVGPAPGTYGPGKTGMSSHLCVAQLAELNMGHKGELPVAKDAPKCPHHDWVPGLTLLASLVLISWSCLCKNTRGAEGSIKKRLPLCPGSPEEDILWMEEELGQVGPMVMPFHGSALRVHSSSRGLTCHPNGLMTGDRDRSG